MTHSVDLQRRIVACEVASVIGIRSESERVKGVLVCLSLLLFLGGMFNAIAYV